MLFKLNICTVNNYHKYLQSLLSAWVTIKISYIKSQAIQINMMLNLFNIQLS